MEANDNPARATDIFTVTLVVFLTLKLAGLVTWPWIWVLSPLWIEVGLWLLLHALLSTFLSFREKNRQ